MTTCARCRRRQAVWELPLGPHLCDDCYAGFARTSGLATRLASVDEHPDAPAASATD